MSKLAKLLTIPVVILTALTGCGLQTQSAIDSTAIPLLNGYPLTANAQFQRADSPIPFNFPEDHGPHDNFQTEWWYYTGNLADESGNRFGYQLTFFRRALRPEMEQSERESSLAVEQIYLAHFGLTDVRENRFYGTEKISRGAGGLAGAQGLPYFEVWLKDWSVRQISEHRYALKASHEGISIHLELEDIKGPILQGINGYSQKGPEPGNASYYISQTRLETKGTIKIQNREYSISGYSWMDHEFSTSALGIDQVGWDWFSIQLNNEMEIMVFNLRKIDGTRDEYSSGTIILPSGETIPVKAADFEINVNSTWTSPESGAVYPARWQISIPEHQIQLQINPLIVNQEMRVSFTYWEGAVEISGTVGAKTVTGFGYVELTGYAHSMQGQF